MAALSLRLLCCAAALAGVSGAFAQRYRLTDLGDVGAELLGAYGVNDAGQVVGSISLQGGGDHVSFLWTASDGMQIIVNFSSAANGINATGQIAGEANFSEIEDAFLWTSANGVTDLGNLGASAAGRSINALGHVVGGSFLPGFGEHAFLWTPSGGMRDIGGLGAFNTAIGINDNDVVVGSDIGRDGGRAYTWTSAGGFQILPGLGGSDSIAVAINNAGLVVGASDLASGATHACLWTTTGAATDLGTLGGTVATAQAINASGVVVGDSDNAARNSRAFIWTAGRGMQDLNTLVSGNSGMILTAALGLSNRGLIVGRGLVGTTTHAYLLTPIPLTVVHGPVQFRNPG